VAKYKVLIGIDTPSGRYEADALVDHTSIPSKSIKWLTDQKIIELVSGKAPEVVEETVEEVVEEVVEEEVEEGGF
jgi:uncharacterized protein YlzI (FlbEa/FlbD family)